MNRNLSRTALSALRKTSGKGRAKKGGLPGLTQQHGGVSTQRALAHLMRDPFRAVPTAELERFLTTSALKDEEFTQRLLSEIGKLGLKELDLPTLQGLVLKVDPRGLKVLGDVIAAMVQHPAAEGSGVTIQQMKDDAARRHALQDLDERLEAVEKKVRSGKQMLEAWQEGAQSAIAAALLMALAGAETEEEYMDLLGDAVDVLRLEEGALQQLIDTRKENAESLAGLGAEVAALKDEVLFLKTMQDLRENRRPPADVLARMADYYATRSGAREGAAAPEKDKKLSPGRKRPRSVE
jgi:hypothetical protein